MVENQHHADVKIHPPVLLLIHIFVAFLLNWIFPLSLAFPNSLVWIGYFLILAGLWLAISAVSQLMKAQTTLYPHGSVTQIVTGGAYSFSRNPIYLGFICFLIGLSLVFRTYWGLIVSPLFMLLLYQLVIKHEEAYLEKKFGAVYTSYKSRVRRWL